MDLKQLRNTAPVVSPDAHMLIGENWSGWVWESTDVKGERIFWLRYREAGQTGSVWKWFKKAENLEQYIDALDIPF